MPRRSIPLLIYSALFLVGRFALAQTGVEANGKTVLRTKLLGAYLDPSLPDMMKFDVRQGYYLVRHTDGLGRALVVKLLLFPDPKKNRGYQPSQDIYNTKLQREPLLSVRQGYGVNIGDTPRQVEQKLGRAPDYHSYSSRQGRGIYRYRSPIMISLNFKKALEKWEYTADYRFENGRLRVIEYEARYPFGDEHYAD